MGYICECLSYSDAPIWIDPIPIQVQEDLDCGSSIEGVITSSYDIHSFSFNNSYIDNNLTASSCGPSGDSLLILRDVDFSVMNYGSGCDVNEPLRSLPLAEGLYFIQFIPEKVANGTFTIELNCDYPTYSPTREPTTAKPTS